MKKICFAALILVIAITGVWAKGAQETADEKQGDNKLVWAAYGYLNENKSERIAEAFNKVYPDVELEYVDLGSKDYITRLDTMIAAGERVDMALAMDFTEYSRRALNDMFLPIGDYLESDGFDILDGFGDGIKASYLNDELYGLPYTKGGFYVFYNKDMFDAAGLPYPTDDWTWEEFEATAKKLTHGKGAEKVYGANVHLTWGYDLETLPAQAAGWKAFKDGDKTMPAFDDPRLVKSMEMWNRMQNVDETAIKLSTFKVEQIGSRMPFAQGDAAMLLSNWWSLAWFKNAKFGSAEGDQILDFNLGIVNLPRTDKDAPNNLNATDLNWYFAVPRTAESPKEGALLARFIITEMWSKMGVLSSYRHQNFSDFKEVFNKYTDADGNVHDAAYSDELVTKIMGNTTVPISAYYNVDPGFYPEGFSVLKNIYDQERELYYSGQQSIKETIDALQERGISELKMLD